MEAGSAGGRPELYVWLSEGKAQAYLLSLVSDTSEIAQHTPNLL